MTPIFILSHFLSLLVIVQAVPFSSAKETSGKRKGPAGNPSISIAAFTGDWIRFTE